MNLPLTTPCAHNFCKSCLQDAFAGQTFIKERTCEGRRTSRAEKNVMKCPSCSNDISEYLQNPHVYQVNRELMSVIESLQRQTKEMEEDALLEEETLDMDDVKEEDKDDKAKAKAEVKDENSEEADDKVDSANNEGVKEMMKKKGTAKPPKANKKRKADNTSDAEVKYVKSEEADGKVDSANSERVKESDEKEAAAKTLKTNKKRKAAVTAEKRHEETANDIKATSHEPGLTEVNRTSKRKKDGDGKCSLPTGAGAKTRSNKAK